MKLLDDGITTKEHVLVPECVHTVTVEWFSSYNDDHVSCDLMLLWHALIMCIDTLMLLS